jgi:hypothetical protein
MKTSYKYKLYGLVLLAVILIFSLLGCSKNGGQNQSQVQGYPIDSRVSTTLDRTVMPVPVPATSPKILPSEVSRYTQYGYGLWQYGGGLDYEKRLDLMPVDYKAASAIDTARLLNFFDMTDIHVTDKESPAQAILQLCFIPLMFLIQPSRL